MSIERFGGIRVRIAAEAARLMYEEGINQYFTAKRMACKRILGRAGGRSVRYRPSDLPSNGEIRDALLALAELAEGSRRTRRLFAMRIVALEAMRAIAPFAPRLIGSVSTGASAHAHPRRLFCPHRSLPHRAQETRLPLGDAPPVAGGRSSFALQVTIYLHRGADPRGTRC